MFYTLHTRSDFYRSPDKREYGQGVINSAIEQVEEIRDELNSDMPFTWEKMQEKMKNRKRVD